MIYVESWWNEIDGGKTKEICSHDTMKLMGKPKNLEKNLSLCHLSTSNPTWTKLGMNLGLCGEMPATNRLSHGMA
jgi:hypothetical protein